MLVLPIIGLNFLFLALVFLSFFCPYAEKCYGAVTGFGMSTAVRVAALRASYK